MLKAEKSSESEEEKKEEEEHDASPDFIGGAGELDLETQEDDEVGVFACVAEGEICSSLHRVAKVRGCWCLSVTNNINPAGRHISVVCLADNSR